MPTAEVRDAVHGLILLAPTEWAVIDTRAFQRLRGVGQLAMTHLVYPGARHSRAEHCMGACHVAGRLCEAVNRRSGLQLDTARVRLAALVHDIGHGPFSHVSEFVFEALTNEEHVHEKLSAAIVRHHPALTAALGDDAAWIAELLTGTGAGKSRSVERDIVAGPADIDKLDYLLRDSLFCGVDYGRYDIAKVIESAVGVEVPGGGTQLAFHPDGIYALEGMLLARYHMHRQVYGHKTRVATDRMLVRAMTLGVEERVLPRDVFAPPSDPDATFVNEYMRWDDAEVTKCLLAAPNTRAGQVMDALVSRELMKRVVRLDFDDLEQTFDRYLAGFVMSIDSDRYVEAIASAEERLAGVAGVEPHWVSLYWQTDRNPVASRFSPRMAPNQVLIAGGDRKPESFEEMSEVFGAGDVRGPTSVSLYLRPQGGASLGPAKLEELRESFIDELRQLGEDAARV